jgi:hypothetical protein
VVSSSSRWNSDGSRIYTDVTVVHDDGTTAVVTVPGGSVGGIAMKVFDLTAPGAPRPAGDEGLAIDFVREKTKMGMTPLHWTSGCVYLTPNSAGVSDLNPQTFDVIQQVADSITSQIASCSYMRFKVDPPKVTEAKYDHVNTIIFREDSWCRPASGSDPMECYSPSQIAVTTLFYTDKPGTSGDGDILDADVEIDAVDWAISICDPTGVNGCTTMGTGPKTDLANTLTHELGHMLGLDHTCWDMSGPPPTDANGQPVPSCFPMSSLPPVITESTMYNFQDPAETKKRSLEPDDINGLCTIYPLADDPKNCDRSGGGGGCDVAPGASGSGLAAGFMILLTGTLAGRRRRRRLSTPRIQATGSR